MNDEQSDFLDRNGYLVIANVLSADLVKQMKERLESLTEQEGPLGGSARLTRWQQRLVERSSKSEARVWAIYCCMLAVVKTLSNRYFFRLAPALKDRMLTYVAMYPYPRSLWGSIWAELAGMLHAGASEEAGVVRICDLVNKDAIFDACLLDKVVLSAAQHVVGTDLKLSSLNYRAAQPSGGLQPLHVDWFDKRPSGQVQACNTLWLLDDLSVNNGATRVVPGSHRRKDCPAQQIEDPWLPHSDEILIVACAGSVLIVNGQVWHGGTLNRSSEPRRLIQGYFVGREVNSQLDQKLLVTASTLARLSARSRYLIGLDKPSLE
jgi:ectoine hydroxylase-related dioxygenase (phytanoyl-CoA dioxygenase family)